ncbi:hypothetical protein BDU57DRAFT_456381 [Ampelomyces quisqualis]|uniref:Uncharacterized protein n=1 Tax=Ampelomyces quisqualis TaxID=50730 RepID=A0A6A5QFW4_AMPQU|nr:hypothetical protein BDU57DRAFT_456381 [Ampelomyces quisqualis]
MSPAPDPEPPTPVSTLSSLHRQQRIRGKVQDAPQPRGRDATRYELGRRDRHSETVTRIYPRHVHSPPPASRLSSASPPAPPAYNAATSPLLSALGATRTNEWTKSVPFFTNQGSPNTGGIAIAGSPPTLHNSPGAHQPMSNSPPASRPLSHPSPYTNFGGRLSNSPRDASARDRRASMYAHQGARPPSQHFVPNPPLPHQPQAHFYGLPDLDLRLNTVASEGIAPGEGGYFCGFDTLGMAGDAAARLAENVLLIGQQGGLDVFRVEKSKLELVGRLEGLKGAVIGAKIIPCTSRRDALAQSRPLVAITLHGPVMRESRSSQSGSGSSSVVDDSASESPSRPASLHGDHSATQVTGYQTSVEVYSLKERRRLAVLYRSPLVPLTCPLDSPLFQPPSPVGEFTVDARGRFVVVASGSSGEVFIFAPYLQEHDDYPERYRCIGKVWTSVQLRERPIHSSASSATDGSQDEVPHEKYRVPLFSLSDRWLSVTPPGSSALYAVNGVALTSPYYERPPGIMHHTVPPQPSANCTVEAPEAASLIDRLAREGTQVAIKGARWATEKGMQAFKAYMTKNTQANGTNVSYTQDPMQQYFPPTHGHNQTQPRQEATVISIYDLQRLVDAEETRNKATLYAVATIPAMLGCSFLSFSPSGLMLMTVSKKGDFQDVWDLKRMNSRRARKTSREQPTGPHVRQVARFARMTVANVIDVAWSTPRMDKVAVITDNGTVHMFPMPASAFQWPPPRRLRQAAPAAKPKDDPALSGPGGAINSAMQTINGTAKPWLDAVRARNSSNGPRFSLSSFGVTPAAGAKSGKAVAAGVGKSIHSIRHAGDNKLALPTSPSGVKPHSVRWLSGKGRGSIAIMSGGVMQIWRVQMRPGTSKGKSSNATAVSKKKIVEFGLAPIRNSALPPVIAELLLTQPGDTEPAQDCYGDWFPCSLPSRNTAARGAKHSSPSPAPLSFSEIETNPPYQPFYTDRRVTRFVYSRPFPDILESTTSSSEHRAAVLGLLSDLHHDNDDSPWLFGQDVEAVRISSPAAHTYDSGDDDFVAGVAARIENKLVLRDGEEEVEQVIVTTRRRRVRNGGEREEEGFFEDDCEVLDFAEDRV